MTTTPPPTGDDSHSEATKGEEQEPVAPRKQQGPAAPRNAISLPAPLAALPAGVWRWVGGAVSAFLGVTVLLTILLMIVMSAVSDTGSDIEDEGLEDSGSTIQVLAMVAVFGWTSRLGIAVEDSGVSGGGGVTAPVLLWTLLACAGLAWASWVLTRRFPPTGTRNLHIQLALATLGALVVLLVIGAVGRLSTDGVTLSALGFWAVVRMLLLVWVSLLIGALLTLQRDQRLQALLGTRVADRVRPFMSSLDLAFWHVAAWTVVGLVVGLVGAIVIRGDIPFGLSLSFLSSSVPLLASLGHFGAVGASASGEQGLTGFLPDELDEQIHVALWTEGTPWAAWLLVIVAAAIIVGLAVRLTLCRRPGAEVDLRQLAITFATFLVVWFLIGRIVGVVSTGLSFDYGSEGGEGSLSISPSWWTLVMLALAGVVGELVHVFAGVQLVERLPRGLLRWLAPTPHPEWARYLTGGQPAGAAQPSTGYEATATDSDAATTALPAAATATGGPSVWSAAPGGPAGQPQPMSRRTKLVLSGCAGVVGLFVVAWFVIHQVDQRYFGPEGVALDYASSVVNGHAEEAVEVGRMNIENDDRVLMADEVYEHAENRPSSAEVVDVTESDDGDSATVEVEFEQNGKRYTQDLTATRTGHTMLFFSEWELEPVDPGTAEVTVMGDTMTVNGQKIDVAKLARPGDEEIAPLPTDSSVPSGYTLAVPALPGTYTFGIPETDYVRSEPVEVRVSADPGEGGSADAGGTVQAVPTQEFIDEVNQQIADRIDTCIDDYAAQDECPFDSTYTNESGMGAPTFSIGEYPQFTPSDTFTITEGIGQSLDLDSSGDAEVTEKARCTRDVTFGCSRGETEKTTDYVDTYGWTVMLTDGKVDVRWSDDASPY